MLLLRDIVLPGERSFFLFLSRSLIAGVRYCHQRERRTRRSPRRAFTGRIICINTKAPGVYARNVRSNGIILVKARVTPAVVEERG